MIIIFTIIIIISFEGFQLSLVIVHIILISMNFCKEYTIKPEVSLGVQGGWEFFRNPIKKTTHSTSLLNVFTSAPASTKVRTSSGSRSLQICIWLEMIEYM